LAPIFHCLATPAPWTAGPVPLMLSYTRLFLSRRPSRASPLRWLLALPTHAGAPPAQTHRHARKYLTLEIGIDGLLVTRALLLEPAPLAPGSTPDSYVPSTGRDSRTGQLAPALPDRTGRLVESYPCKYNVRNRLCRSRKMELHPMSAANSARATSYRWRVPS
jgi:hypothetical protein